MSAVDLFNALTQNSVSARRPIFRFCTIEPNVGEVAVPNAALDKLAEIAGPSSIIPTTDERSSNIAGLSQRRVKPDFGQHFLQIR